MKMMIAKKLILGFALMVTTTLTMAVQPDGMYVGEDVGRSIFKKSCSGISTSYKSCKDYDFSHRISVGYKFSELNASEISYYSSGQTVKKNIGNISDAIDSVEWQFSGLRYFPIAASGGRFLMFGRYGAVHWEASEATIGKWINTSGNSILLGIGAKYYITQDTAARIQYELHKVGNSAISWRGDISFFSAGLTYHF
jgi:hypothetical protein